MTVHNVANDSHQVVILGAGHAGGLAAAQLRQLGFPGTITLIGAEDRPPYQRPPLSKAWLVSEAADTSVLLKPEEWYDQNNVQLRTGTKAVALDRATRRVRLGQSDWINYDTLIIATGSHPRTLPIEGADSENVFTVRTPQDAKALRAELGKDKTFVLIGAGYIGLEVAAAIQKTGGRAIVVEREARILARVASPTFAAFAAKRHVVEGVQFECGASVSGFEIEADRVVAAILQDGRKIACDGIVIGVGVQANDELAQAAGLECADGILVDEQSRTGDPHIYAIGDVSRRPVTGCDEIQRLESVPSAIEQARQVAQQLSGKEVTPSDIPWFWSDQYDMKLQIAGLWANCEQQVVRKTETLDRFMVLHLSDGRIRAVESCGSVQDFMAARKLIAAGQTVDIQALCEPDIALKSLLQTGG